MVRLISFALTFISAAIIVILCLRLFLIFKRKKKIISRQLMVNSLIIVILFMLVAVNLLPLNTLINFHWNDKAANQLDCELNLKSCNIGYAVTCSYFGLWSPIFNLKWQIISSCMSI